MISEVRTIAADDLWMSPCYRQPCVAFHFSFKQDWPALRPLLPGIEEALAPFRPAPALGQDVHHAARRGAGPLRKAPGLPRPCSTTHDPDGKFRNAFLDKYVFGAETERVLRLQREPPPRACRGVTPAEVIADRVDRGCSTRKALVPLTCRRRHSVRPGIDAEGSRGPGMTAMG